MLKIRLIRRGTAQQELLWLCVVTVLVIGVVIDDLVIVPHQHPRVCGMCGLQMWVAFVLLVTIAIALQSFGLFVAVFANGVFRIAALINIVTHEEYKVEFLLRYLTVCDELPMLIVLAR